MALPNFLRTFLQRSIIAGTGLSGGGPLSRDVTLTAKLTDSVASAASDTAASAKAVKAAYDRGSAGITAAAAAQASADGKAPGGFGLGTLLSSTPASIAADLNTTKLTGWYAVRPQTLNKPGEVDYAVCTVVAHDNNEIHQTLFSRYGVYHRYISISGAVYRAWVKLFDSNYECMKAVTADSTGALSGMKVTNQWTNRVTAPAGGTWYWVNVNEEWLVNVGGPVAGGSGVSMGSYSRSTLWIPSGA